MQTVMEEEVNEQERERERVRNGSMGLTDPLIALVGNPPFWFAFKSHFSATDDD